MALIGLTGLGFAQEKGIRFEQGQSWTQIKAKAKTENKFIFMDVFATWCGPCKQMDKEVYPSEKLGTFINEKFISVKVQTDQTKEDNERTKDWYMDAKHIVSNYKIEGYPTLLFFSPDGKLVNRSFGFKDADGLIKLAGESIDIKKPYYAKLEQFKQGKLSAPELKEFVKLAKSFDEMETAQKVADRYINDYLFKLNENELFSEENLLFMGSNLGSEKSKAFKLFTDQKDKVNAVLGFYEAQNAIMMFIEKNYLPNDKTWKEVRPDWDAIEKTVVAKFGVVGKERVYEQRMVYYQQTEDWKNYGIWYHKYFKNYLKTIRLDPNNLSWTLFEHISDQKVLTFACDTVMTYAFEKWTQYQNDFAVYDTIANLLYKIGKKDQAIEWEEKAAKLSNNDKVIVETLEKMKTNQRTWPETAKN